MGGPGDPANSRESAPTAHTADDRHPTASSGDPAKAINPPPGPSSPASPPPPGSPAQSEEKAPVVYKNRYIVKGSALAATPLPKLGRRLHNYVQALSPDQDQSHQYATGGVVLKVRGETYYQLTVKCRLRLYGSGRAPEEATYSEEDLVHCSLDIGRQSGGYEEDAAAADSSDSEDEAAIATPASGSPRSLSRAGEDADEDTTEGACQASPESTGKATTDSTSPSALGARENDDTERGVHHHHLQHMKARLPMSAIPGGGANQLVITNLPDDTTQEEMEEIFSKLRGFKSLALAPISEGTIALVWYENASAASSALYQVFGTPIIGNLDDEGFRRSMIRDIMGADGLEYLKWFVFDHGPNAVLDYALHEIKHEHVVALGEDLNRVPVPSPTPLRISRIGEVGIEEHRVIAITASAGAIRGLLTPSPILYQRPGTSRKQKIYQVQLEAASAEGDSGSAVVDEETGCLYGHIILRNPTATTVYITPAVDVFADIRQNLGPDLTLASPFA